MIYFSQGGGQILHGPFKRNASEDEEKLKCTCDEYLISLQTEMNLPHGVWCGHGGIL